MMKKEKIIVALSFALVSLPVLAQDDATRPRPTLLRQDAPEARQEQLKRNQAEREEMRLETEVQRKARNDEAKIEREKMQEERQTMRADAFQARAEMKDATETEREARKQEMEQKREEAQARREEAKQMIEQKREVRKQEMERKREIFKQQMESRRELAKTRRETQREELKNKLAVIKDERKKQLVEGLDTKFSNVNTKQLESMSGIVDRLDEVVQNITVRADKVETNGQDVNSVRTAISTAKGAINAARNAIVNQTGKTYPIDVTDEATLKNAVSTVRQSLQVDLTAVRALVKTAHETVRAVADTLKSIPNVDAPVGVTDSSTTSTEENN